MYDLIYNTLIRQERGLHLLSTLLDEELTCMLEQNTVEIMSLEFSIHELVRQLVREKNTVMKMLGGGRLRDYSAMRTEEEQVELAEILAAIDKKEQYCSLRASQNAELSLSLLDQSERLLNFLHEKIQPKPVPAYGRKGKYYKPSRAEATLIVGSL